MNNLIGIVKEGECKQKLLDDPFRDRYRYPGIRKEFTILGKVWTHRFENKTGVLAIGAIVLELVDQM